MEKYLIVPSILAADFARLGEDTAAVINAGGDMVHFDVMDNHYVPNLTMGAMYCQALRDFGISAPIDVHLMTIPVDPFVIMFAKAGANIITFHPDASLHVDRTIQLIHEQGCLAGIALNPATSLNCLDYIMDKLDIILVMTVNPGFGGQPFIASLLDKISAIRDRIDLCGRPIRLEVDGGINLNNIGMVAAAGADTFVAGSAIFNSSNYTETIKLMREQIHKVTL